MKAIFDHEKLDVYREAGSESSILYAAILSSADGDKPLDLKSCDQLRGPSRSLGMTN
jgi:hypothetical protein